MQSPDAVASNVQIWLREIADLFGRVSQKEAFNRMSRMTGLTVGQIKRLFYAEWRIIPAHVFIAVANAYRNAIARAQKFAEHQRNIRAALTKEWDDEWNDISSSAVLAPPGGEPIDCFSARSP